MGKFKQVIAKEGETIGYYAHTLGSRNSTTNRKVSQWAASTNITAVVRSQPSMVEERSEGTNTIDSLIILTETAIVKHSVVKWNSKYFDIVMVEEVFWGGSRDYYKGTCIERLEFLGS